MRQQIDSKSGAQTAALWLVGAFGGVALFLGAIGLYGVMSYAVSQRTQEIGVRLALGAAERQIFALVVGETLKLAAAGLVLGLAGAIAVGQLLQKLLYGVRATDPGTFAATATVLLLVAVLATCVPARRAMRTDPMAALRTE